MLEAKNLTVHYGQVRALLGVDLHVDTGEIVSLIGPNGAGKTTTLNALAGVLPREGEVILDGEPLPPSAVEVVKRGMALVPQGRKVFPSMTVEENLLLGGYARHATWRVAKELFAPIYHYFPRLEERRRQPAGKLSGGEQQMLVIGRALLAQPKIMLVDELSLGLAPLVVQTLLEMIVRLKEEQGVTFLLVEQAAPAALEISSRAYLLQKGQVVYGGDAKTLLQEVDVLRSAYLGAGPKGQQAPALRR